MTDTQRKKIRQKDGPMGHPERIHILSCHEIGEITTFTPGEDGIGSSAPRDFCMFERY